MFVMDNNTYENQTQNLLKELKLFLIGQKDEPQNATERYRDNEWKKLEYYREEVRHEFNLMFSRFNVLLTCQSFLAVLLALLYETPNAFLFKRGICALGFISTLLLFIPILQAQQAIEPWLNRTIDTEEKLLIALGDRKRRLRRHYWSTRTPDLVCIMIMVTWVLAGLSISS